MPTEVRSTVNALTRRDFIRFNLLGMAGLGFPRRPHNRDVSGYDLGLLGRIASDEKQIYVHQKPSPESDIVRETRFDELIPLYYPLSIPDEEGHPVLWHRVWGGYLPGAYVQPTRFQLHAPAREIQQCGQLAEVSVPFTEAFVEDKEGAWQKKYRLYYQTTHWVTDILQGPDDRIWYRLTSELSDTLYYFVRAAHLRLIPVAEYLPTRITVPPEEKRIEVSILKQTLTAFEAEKPVFTTKISSGIGYHEVPHGTGTPRGVFRVTSKYPSKHMGSTIPTGAPGSYSLPGVPWSTFFIYKTGVAFHGTYWHNDYGRVHSHGCVNLLPVDAKWVFRWAEPVIPYEEYTKKADPPETGTPVIVV